MGAVVSRWKSKPSTVDVLEGIDKDIHKLEEHGEKYHKQQKVWVRRLLWYSCLLYLITCAVVYLWYLPERTVGRVVLALPFVVFPLLVWLLRRMLIALCAWRTKRNDEKLEELKTQKQKILEDVMETETYKNAKLILERFDPNSKNKELNSSLISAQMTPKAGPGTELRQRSVASRATPMAPGEASLAGATVGTAARPPPGPGPLFAGRSLHAAPGGPPERGLSAGGAGQSLMRRPVTPGTPAPGGGMHPPGPPLARPVLPRERGAMDRVVEYLVGYGPQNRYALICQQCLSHNGMALKEEFEYVAFRCAYCYVLNPARKTRPQAPRLLETPGADQIAASEVAAASPPGVEPDAGRCVPAKTKLEFPGEGETRELKAPPGGEASGTSDDLGAMPLEEGPEEELPSEEKPEEEQDVSAMEVE